MKKTIIYIMALLLAGCSVEAPKEVKVEVMNLITPVKNQGQNQLCWAYSMLAVLETELFRQGDSADLPIEPVAAALAAASDAPTSGRAMAPTFLNLARAHGLYSEVCNPDDYMALCSTRKSPYGEWVVLDLPDNWEGNKFWNMPSDSLLTIVERAVRNHRGVCWEGDISERGFSFEKGVARRLFPSGRTSDDHCMAIIGIAHDEKGDPYFIMKNTWGPYNHYGGLMLMSFDYFRHKTIAVVLPKEAVR